MTQVTIDDRDPRSIRAVEIAAGAGQWLKCRMRDGLAVFGVPSQCHDGRYYLTTIDRCDCEDAHRHPGKPCKHELAVRLHMALVKGSRGLTDRQCTGQQRCVRSPFVASHTTDAGETVYLPRRFED